jgi:hypothetical protein
VKRFLILLLLAGCSPSITELQARRDELEKTAVRLNYEAGMMEKWLDGEELAAIKTEVDRIRGEEYVDACRDNKKTQLAKVLDQLGSVEKKLEKAVID